MIPPPSAAERLRRTSCRQQPTGRSPVRYLSAVRVPQAARGWNQTTEFPALAQPGCPGRPVLPRPVPGRRLPLAGRTRTGIWSYRTSISAHSRASAASHLLSMLNGYRSAARRAVQHPTTRPVRSPLPADGLVGGAWTCHWGAPAIRQHRELAAMGWVPPAARDQACDVRPDGHLNVALMVTLIPRSRRQPSRAHREIAHRGPARAGLMYPGSAAWPARLDPREGHALSLGACESTAAAASSSRKPPDWCRHSLA